MAQQFSQGNINITGNSLDVAINGNGFFEVTRSDGSTAFTRDGQLKLDKDGNIITNTGAKVMGYTTDINTGAPTSVTPQPLSVPTSAPIPANATTAITAGSIWTHAQSLPPAQRHRPPFPPMGHRSQPTIRRV